MKIRVICGLEGISRFLQNPNLTLLATGNWESRMGHKTPLFDEHVALGARIVPFEGWDMPLHYGSQVWEHHQVRLNAGMFDVSHMRIIDLERSDAPEFLGRLIANDPARLRVPGQALYSCMLNRQGGIIDDLILYFRAPTCYRLVVNAAARRAHVEPRGHYDQ